MNDDEKARGATLVYLVKLQVEKGKDSGDQRLFISARDGSVVWQYNFRALTAGLGRPRRVATGYRISPLRGLPQRVNPNANCLKFKRNKAMNAVSRLIFDMVVSCADAS
jgi:hypothetical protein